MNPDGRKNRCKNCDHSWKPRKSTDVPRCPQCRSREVFVDSAVAEAAPKKPAASTSSSAKKPAAPASASPKKPKAPEAPTYADRDERTEPSAASLGHGEVRGPTPVINAPKSRSPLRWLAVSFVGLMLAGASFMYFATDGDVSRVLPRRMEPPAGGSVQPAVLTSLPREPPQAQPAPVAASSRHHRRGRVLGTIEDVRELWSQHPNDLAEELGTGRLHFSAVVSYTPGQRLLYFGGEGEGSVSCVMSHGWQAPVAFEHEAVEVNGRFLSLTAAGLQFSECTLSPIQTE